MKKSDYTIFVIEDDVDLRNTLEDLLSFNGYTVKSASNGVEGCRAVLENIPDLIICDVNMPHMNGYEVLKTLNEKLSPDEKPIFMFLTARVQFDDIKIGLDLGADDYIPKPFDIERMLNSIKTKLEERNS